MWKVSRDQRAHFKFLRAYEPWYTTRKRKACPRRADCQINCIQKMKDDCSSLFQLLAKAKRNAVLGNKRTESKAPLTKTSVHSSVRLDSELLLVSSLVNERPLFFAWGDEWMNFSLPIAKYFKRKEVSGSEWLDYQGFSYIEYLILK